MVRFRCFVLLLHDFHCACELRGACSQTPSAFGSSLSRERTSPYELTSEFSGMSIGPPGFPGQPYGRVRPPPAGSLYRPPVVGGPPGPPFHQLDTLPPLSLSEDDCQALAAWVDSVIRQNGGRIMGANLGSALANSNRTLYRKIKCVCLSCACACTPRST